MAQIVHLDDHRRMREPERGMATNLSRRRPHLSDRDLWTRDYGQIDNILYAILKIKGYSTITSTTTMCGRICCSRFWRPCTIPGRGRQGAARHGASLKDYVLSAITRPTSVTCPWCCC